MSGKVYIVGAGPGDVGLITVRAVECLRLADVVIYDYLVNADLLEWVRADAETVYVGKRGGTPSIKQTDINALIIDRARAGKTVVRLKGGDPFVFGRGAEELLALAEHGIAYEVVPGITSALAAPAYAGIPVTHREMASSVCIVTGHEAEEKEMPALDWGALARTKGTLVVMMGVGNIGSIAEELVKHGMPPATPTAVIRWGTYPNQVTITSTLRDVASEVERQHIEPPAVIVVGECVALRESLKWFEAKPLFGRRIAVTRPKGQEHEFVAALRERGAEVYSCPTIQINPLRANAQMDSAIEALADFDWIIFTSRNGVEIFLQRVWELGKDARAFGGARIAAIGEKTAAALRQYGLQADVVPEEYTQEGLAEALNVGYGERVLLARAAAARDFLPEELRQRGAEVVVLHLYETLGNAEGIAKLKQLLEQRAVDAVTFTSASTVEQFMKAITEAERERLFTGVLTASIGPVTSETLKDFGISAIIEAKRATFEGLIEALEKQFGAKSA